LREGNWGFTWTWWTSGWRRNYVERGEHILLAAVEEGCDYHHM